MARKEKNTPEQIAAALKATNGLVYLAADRLGVAASTIYRAAERHETVKEAIKHEKGKRLDTAEAALWKAVLAGEAWAVCFLLKTQGKERGYVERSEQRHEHSGPGGGPIKHDYGELLKLPAAELLRLYRQAASPANGSE